MKFLAMILGCLINVYLFSQIRETPPVQSLKALYSAQPQFKATVDSMFAHVQPLPNGEANPWKGKGIDALCDFLDEWYYFLPNAHNGLDRIVQFSFLYYKNPYGYKFIREEPGISWSLEFVEDRGAFMDSPESQQVVKEWLEDQDLDQSDFVTPNQGFSSFNEFFIRELKPGARPIDGVGDPSVLVAPADGIINMIANDLTLDTRIPTKGGMTMNLNELLDHSSYAEKFVGGKSMAVFLMPDDYHHYHAPVDGIVVESKESVGKRLFGMSDILDFINEGNVAYNKDYSVLEDFRHGYFVIKTENYGLVAMIPIGLQTVGSVVFEDKFKSVSPENPIQVHKGDQLGHFKYGGSTVLLIFEPQRLESLKIKQGQQIGILNKL